VAASPGSPAVEIFLLGGFRVVLGGREASPWPTRRAQELVQVLALAEGRRLLRDRVIDQLWPHLGAEAGGANLRKAAHHARRAVGHPETVVLRGGWVELLPGLEVRTDVERFLREAASALGDGEDGDPAACARVAATCPGELLPGAAYEPWAQDPRRHVRARHAALLRTCGDWERLVRSSRPRSPPTASSCAWRSTRAAGTPRCGGTSACGSPWPPSSASARTPRPRRCTTAAPRASGSASPASSAAPPSWPQPWRRSRARGRARRRRCSSAARPASASRPWCARPPAARRRRDGASCGRRAPGPGSRTPRCRRRWSSCWPTRAARWTRFRSAPDPCWPSSRRSPRRRGRCAGP
jgi:hypothetical protein